MTIDAFCDYVRGLVGLYSSQGRPLGPEDQDIADLCLRMSGHLQAALLEIAGTTDLYRIEVPLQAMEATEKPSDRGQFTLPDCYLRGQPVTLLLPDRGESRNLPVMQEWDGVQGRSIPRVTLPPHRRDGVLSFRRRPAPPTPGEPLDAPAEALLIAGYYVAAMLMLTEDALAYTALRREYSLRLGTLQNPLRATVQPIRNVMTPGIFCI